MQDEVDGLDWADIAAQLDQEGHAVLPGLLDEAKVRALAALCGRPGPWPGFVAALQAALYARLAPIANCWNARTARPRRHPATLQALRAKDGGVPQHGAQPQLCCLQAGEDRPLQHGSEDAQAFPLQLAILLGTPGQDFTGGECVLTEQRPRMQSRPMVLPLRRGDIAVFAVAQRPHAGAHGDYTVRMRHGIARVRSGRRLGLELLFDGAAP